MQDFGSGDTSSNLVGGIGFPVLDNCTEPPGLYCSRTRSVNNDIFCPTPVADLLNDPYLCDRAGYDRADRH